MEVIVQMMFLSSEMGEFVGEPAVHLPGCITGSTNGWLEDDSTWRCSTWRLFLGEVNFFFIPIPSMRLVYIYIYLPTWTVDFHGIHVYVNVPYMDPMGFGRKSRNFRPNFPKQKKRLFFPPFFRVKKNNPPRTWAIRNISPAPSQSAVVMIGVCLSSKGPNSLGVKVLGKENPPWNWGLALENKK